MKKYPPPFITETQTGDDGYPTYRKRSPEDTRCTAFNNLHRTIIYIDNRWIVLYNLCLLRTFNAHINVEYCHSVQYIKKICKYINKGFDPTTFSIKNDELIE